MAQIRFKASFELLQARVIISFYIKLTCILPQKKLYETANVDRKEEDDFNSRVWCLLKRYKVCT